MQRARMFQTALQDLATWWANDFFDVSDPTIGIRTRSWDEVMEIVEGLPRLVQNAALQIVVDAEDGDIATAASKGKLRAKESLDEKVVEDFIAALGEGGERLRTVNSMMKKALQGNGGRDTSAQLFVALCRSLGLGARLVVSIQAVQWKADKQPTTKPPKKKTPKPPPDLVDVALAKRKRMPVRRRGKMPEKTASEEDEEDEMEEVEIPGIIAGGPSRMSTPASTPGSRNKFPKGKGNRLQERAAGTASDPESVLTDASSKSAKLNIGKDGAMNPLKKERAEYYKLGKSKVGQKLGGPSKPKRRKDEG
jgi:xeroderma pigmentosum group C-complementing protein